ncbi:hypothetical protein PC123_g10420 [Phytophthora cactorum]|nr:hypothetical protein PC123_g10420 [Phytophthora cactorum]
MLGLWRLARGGLGSAANQYNEQLLFMPLRTATMAVVACGWEFIVEMTRSNESVRALLLILPQILLLLVVVSQFFPALQPRNRKQLYGIYQQDRSLLWNCKLTIPSGYNHLGDIVARISPNIRTRTLPDIPTEDSLDHPLNQQFMATEHKW